MYSEIPEKGDWDGRGFVMRIGCACDQVLKDEADGGCAGRWRTAFLPYNEAVESWNKAQSLKRFQ